MRDAEPLTFEQQPRESRVNWQSCRGLPEFGERSAFQQLELLQQLQRLLNGLGTRRIEPRELQDVGFAQREQVEDRPAQIDAANLGLGLFGPAAVAGFIPKADAEARLRSPRATGSLIGRGPRDRHEPQAIHANGRFELHLPGEAGVDHDRDAIDRDGCFRDVGGEHDLAGSQFLQGAVLLLGRQVTVKGKDFETRFLLWKPGFLSRKKPGFQSRNRVSKILEFVRGFANLAEAGQERKYVAIGFIEGIANRVRHGE